MNVKITLFALIFCLSGLGTVQAAPREYKARMYQSQWISEGTRLVCGLKHDIPLFGEVTFKRLSGPGENLLMEVRTQHDPYERGDAVIYSRAPAWKHRTASVDIGMVKVGAAKLAMHKHDGEAQRMLYELESGMMPTFAFRDWADGRDHVRVSLSNVNFLKAYKEFQLCSAALLPVNWDSIKNSKVLFKVDRSEIRPQYQRLLDNIADYLKEDPSVRLLVVAGHADSTGFRSYNDGLSQRRADAVRKYLLKKGVEEKMLEMHYYGERKPAVSNRTAEGRRKNRRVTIQLQN